MAEFLITTQDRNVPDGPNRWYAARIVTIQTDGHQWGSEEGPPKFGIVKVPGISVNDAIQYLETWRHDVSIVTINNDPASDAYRLRVESNKVSVSGKNQFTQQQVAAFFQNWGATIIDLQSNFVVFDITVYQAITSRNFWQADTSQIAFVETNYNQSSGDHIIQIQSSPYSLDRMQAAIKENGGTIVPPDSFNINNSLVRKKFKDDIKEKIDNIGFDRRRWYITASGMSALSAAGGVLTVTPTQFINNLADGLES